MSHNKCNSHHVPIEKTSDRFQLLPHNSQAIRDILLGTNMHLDDPREGREVCNLLNSMDRLAMDHTEIVAKLVREKAKVEEYAVEVKFLKRTISIQESTIDKFDAALTICMRTNKKESEHNG